MIEQKSEKELACCVVSCERPLDEKFWNDQYQSNTTGWDLGEVSPAIKAYIDSIQDKNSAILIPGCGNSYEAEYLLQQGFTNITIIDIAPLLVEKLRQKFLNNSNIKIVHGDFFAHQFKYDLIIEQTFFCALTPTMRPKYVWKMHQLLNTGGLLIGLLFNRTFEQSPPFGGNQEEYKALFKSVFDTVKMEKCKNSVAPRANSELWVELRKSNNKVNLYSFGGFTCSGCVNTVTSSLLKIEGVLNVSISSDFSEGIIVSKTEIPLEILKSKIADTGNYQIQKYIN